MSKKIAAIKLKLQRSDLAMNDARLLMQNQSFNGVVNRIYNSCYYAARALLPTQDVSPNHKGVTTMLNQNFVQKGLFDGKKSAFLSSLMEQRMKATMMMKILQMKRRLRNLSIRHESMLLTFQK